MPDPIGRPKLYPKQVGDAGEHFVAAEIHRRGGYAVTFSGNMKGIDLLASDSTNSRKISIQVKSKSKSKSDWHANVGRDSHQRVADPLEEKFWIFVDLEPEHPKFYIAPAWWVENDIFENHKAYLARHGGVRAHSPDSQHHAVQPKRLEQWAERWEILGIFPTTD